jgi:predicted CXXCH cytochrome family protein
MNGVEGYEDGDWQATSDANDHNEYLGWVGDHEYHAGFYNLGHTMTAFCCGCHGNFHIQQSEGNWIKHASDARLCPNGLDGCETAGYTGYDSQEPVARPSLDGWTQPSETLAPETDLVMCLSCHRPYGSPYPKMLRWDLRGCFNCHTNK